MNILGISAFYHDSAAALVRDGEIVAATQEERFSRKKNDHEFPFHSIQYCLSEAGICVRDVDYVAFYDLPELTFERLLHTYLGVAPRGFEFFKSSVPGWVGKKLEVTEFIRRALDYEGPIFVGEHHRSHAASAFYPSPFSEAAIITVDGVGEWATTSWGVGRGHEIDLRWQENFPDSLGLLYSAFTYFLGFKVNCDEYKVMGLAPYGEPVYVDTILGDLVDLKPDGSFRLNMEYFTFCSGLTMTGTQFEELFGVPRRDPESRLEQVHMDLARSVQSVIEEAMLRIARHVRRETAMRNLCLAGGVALNCVANGKILAENIFDELWIQPAAGDAGSALGVALYVWHQVLQNEKPESQTDSQRDSMLGPDFTDAEIRRFLRANRYPFQCFSDEAALLERTAELIDEGKVVGWFDGRLEFGPRALGGRSIFGDPRSAQMMSRLNLKIKNRESFRPFAPAIQRERVSEFFELESDSPYMLLVAPVVESRQLPLSEQEKNLFGIEKLRVPRSDVPAVTHVDYSARVQTVNREGRRRFHHLLEVFRRRTGYPLLINTSFNVRDEPIVCTPADAYRCFMKTGMDYLVMNNFILDKAEQPKIAPSLTVDGVASSTREKFKLVILGSSTAEGWPFHPLVDIGKLASYYLGEKIGGKDIEIVNLGKAGQPSGEVVENLRAVPADADLVFLYCGHNEYWARYEYPSDLADSKRRMFDEHIAGRRTRRRILVEFRNNLEKIVEHFGRVGVPLIISTAAMNVCGRPPNRSVLSDHANEPKVRALLEEYASHRDRGDVNAALECVTAVLSSEPGLAIAHRYRGDCLRLKGETDEARRAYAMALSHDGFPTASTPEENQVAREVAAKHGLRLFDAEDVLARAARDGLVDNNLMLDAVHPNLEGYAHLGRALAEMIQTVAGDRRPLPDFSDAELEAAFQLDTPKKVQAHLRVCLDLLHSSTMMWGGTEYQERAVEHVLRAAELDPENPEVLFHGFLAEAFRNRLDCAEDYLARALRASEVGTKRRIHPESFLDSLVMQQYIRRTKVGPLLDERGIAYGRGITSRIPIGYTMKAQSLMGWLGERIALPAVYYLVICPFGMLARAAGSEPFHGRPSEHSYWRRYGGSLETMLPANNSGTSYRRALRLLTLRKQWLLVPSALALLLLGKSFRAKANKRVSPLIYALF